MVKWLAIMAAFLLASCGAPAVSQQDAQATAFARINAGLISSPPTAVVTPFPTFTASERAAFETIAQRSAAMKAAGEQLITLAQAVRVDTTWRSQARTAAQVLTGSQKVISAAKLPALYAPLSERAASVTGQCAAAAAAIIAVDAGALAIKDIAEHQEVIQRWCITEMGRLQVQAENP